jgi:hypothetical protein
MCIADVECDKCKTERLLREWSDLSHEEREAARTAMRAKIETEFNTERDEIMEKFENINAKHESVRAEMEDDLKVVQSAERESDPFDVVQFMLDVKNATFDFRAMADCVRKGDRIGPTGKLIDVFLSLPEEARRKYMDQYAKKRLAFQHLQVSVRALQFRLSKAEENRDEALANIPPNVW